MNPIVEGCNSRKLSPYSTPMIQKTTFSRIQKSSLLFPDASCLGYAGSVNVSTIWEASPTREPNCHRRVQVLGLQVSAYLIIVFRQEKKSRSLWKYPINSYGTYLGCSTVDSKRTNTQPIAMAKRTKEDFAEIKTKYETNWWARRLEFCQTHVKSF